MFQKRQDSTFDGIENLPLLSLIAALVGLVVACVVIGFRACIEFGMKYLLGIESDKFETLAPIWHILLPVGGALVAIALLYLLKQESRVVGIVHVLERFNSSDVRMPMRNAAFQFVGGALALILGVSGGREGPAIHLGAWTSSFAAHGFRLPHNSVRVIVACGITAGIAASFDIPIAAVVFTMEVVMLEFTIATFLPLMLAAFAATALVGWIYPYSPIFQHPESAGLFQWDPLMVVGTGIAVGIFASLFKYETEFFSDLKIGQVWQRMLAAGILTGAIALVLPQVMGMGWDTASLLIADESGKTFTLVFLLTLILAKLLVTSACIGSGLPVGMIGPSIVLGVMIGTFCGMLENTLLGSEADTLNIVYGLLGAVAMLGATLNAPLTALLTVVELSSELSLVLPGLLVIVAANFTSYGLYGRRSIFVSRLRSLGIPHPPHPSIQYLRRNSVRACMDSRIELIDRPPSPSDLSELAKREEVAWIVETRSTDQLFVYEVVDLKSEFESSQAFRLSSQSSLEEALTAMNARNLRVVCATQTRSSHKIIGVLTREYIERMQTQLVDDDTRQ
ncbi:MAG: chloride channel protein [Gammaproteobacteria bacterium]|nr:chloride channel protein [Gammaproteobacteria bacterium]